MNFQEILGSCPNLATRLATIDIALLTHAAPPFWDFAAHFALA